MQYPVAGNGRDGERSLAAVTARMHRMLLYLSAVWNCRYFWMSLVRMDLRTRYRRSLLGLGWSLLQPLAMTCILSVVFRFLQGSSFAEYAPHVLTGLLGWNFILYCAAQGCQCFFLGESYIRQCPLPLAIYPLRTAIGGLFHLAMALIVVAGLCAFMRGHPSLAALASLLPTLALLFVLGWSLAVLCGSANVFFQDTQHLTEVGFQTLFYLSPIIYTFEFLLSKPGGAKLVAVLQWNPVVPFLTLLRQPLLNGVPPTPMEYLHGIVVAAVAAGVAIGLLGRLQKQLIFHL
jgi:ABC-type polysaccharide/polyol phosphate export permease